MYRFSPLSLGLESSKPPNWFSKNAGSILYVILDKPPGVSLWAACKLMVSKDDIKRQDRFNILFNAEQNVRGDRLQSINLFSMGLIAFTKIAFAKPLTEPKR